MRSRNIVGCLKLLALICFWSSQILYMFYPLCWEYDTFITNFYPCSIIGGTIFLTISYTFHIITVAKPIPICSILDIIMVMLSGIATMVSTLLVVFCCQEEQVPCIFYLPQLCTFIGSTLLIISSIISIINYTKANKIVNIAPTNV